jgi:chemotaxis protein CheD
LQAGDDGLATRYGVNAMELLINRIMNLGGAKENLRAKVFGGAKMLAFAPGAMDVATLNSEFVLEFLKREGIPLEAYSLGGHTAVTVWFEPVTGRVLIRRIAQPQARTKNTFGLVISITSHRSIYRKMKFLFRTKPSRGLP